MLKLTERGQQPYTPPWPYYGRRKRAGYEGWQGSSMSVEFRTVPDEDGDLGAPV
jgi:hypothetical protein